MAPIVSSKPLTRLNISIAGPIGAVSCNRFCYRMCILGFRTRRQGSRANAKQPRIKTGDERSGCRWCQGGPYRSEWSWHSAVHRSPAASVIAKNNRAKLINTYHLYSSKSFVFLSFAGLGGDGAQGESTSSKMMGVMGDDGPVSGKC
jgi:hypothetical protein